MVKWSTPVPLIIFMDDVLGNVLKQWNKHHAIYMSNANLLREMLEKEFLLIVAAESGIIAWDCKDSEEVMLIPYGLFVTGDNPMQAEECSHAGLNCNYYCRTCDVGGMKEYKESEAGYSKGTVNTVQQQFETAMLLGALKKVKNSVSSTGICDTASASILNTLLELGKKLRKCTVGSPAIPENEVSITLKKEFEQLLQGGKLDDTINPLLGMHAFNVHMDTPTEIFHTILLGVVKYFWGQTHFKSLAQVMPFLIYDLVPPTVLNGWTVMGELVVLVWHTKIANTKVYLAKLTRTIQDFLNMTAQCAPSILISKSKFHFLIHLLAYIRRFGPAIIFLMERYESFNHIFCLSCIYSNRQAPSRDTCKVFAHQDIIKHVATGGYWYDGEIKKWVHAGVQVLSYLDEHPEQAQLLGLSNFSRSTPIPGSGKVETVTGKSRKTVWKDTVFWKDTRCANIPRTILCNPNIDYHWANVFEVIVRPSADGKSVMHLMSVVLHDIVCSVNVQHNCINSHCTDTTQQPIYQEWTITSHSRPIIQHKPTPHYLLNVYSVHNYDYINLVMPNTLHKTPLRVTNVTEVRALAVQQMQEK
ncbi:uncharacterized protein BJ212DRAFT_1444390 [Suillus subaureus]|uniref:Uncharacterized protein n=1 Tax=Suillus subaureus TaxID=48587 RepID=A0A9P7EL31_9AGAM|nr:uncharacterized protein BJ212DRAFT_1444390 [Suillus subaureus]KAG1824629.1 hypothetical protein BJ212DRAFT_1444390 [Suillus subaureus]